MTYGTRTTSKRAIVVSTLDNNGRIGKQFSVRTTKSCVGHRKRTNENENRSICFGNVAVSRQLSDVVRATDRRFRSSVRQFFRTNGFRSTSRTASKIALVTRGGRRSSRSRQPDAYLRPITRRVLFSEIRNSSITNSSATKWSVTR